MVKRSAQKASKGSQGWSWAWKEIRLYMSMVNSLHQAWTHPPTISALSPSFEMDHQRGNYLGSEIQTWITISTAPPRFRYFPRSHLPQACLLKLFHRFTLSYNIARQRLMRLRPVQSSKSRLWGFWGGCSGGVSCWWCVLDLDCMILYVWVAGRWKQNEKTGAKSRINMKRLHPFLQARRRQLGSWHLREYGRYFSSSCSDLNR